MGICYNKKIMRTTKISLSGLLAVLLVLAPTLALAQVVPPLGIPPGSFTAFCASTGLCAASGSVGIALLTTFLLNLVQVIRVVFIGVCTAYFAWFALMMIAKGYEENTLTEQKKAFGYSAMGLGIVGVSSLLVQTFVPGSTGGNLVNPLPFTIAANLVADYITIATGGFLIFVISMAGFRIIALQGNEAEVDKQKKNFFNGLIGIMILLLARIFVFSIVGGSPISGAPAGPSIQIAEVAGIIRFLLEIVATLAVVAFIGAGFFYLISLANDERKQRAKRMLLSTLIILVIVVTSHTIVATFVR